MSIVGITTLAIATGFSVAAMPGYPWLAYWRRYYGLIRPRRRNI